ncbi:unnamed protein product [Diamesa hyperborea]
MRNLVVFSIVLTCLTTSIIAESDLENDLGVIKTKMIEKFCFKFSCLETETVDGKLIVKNLILWQNEIEFLKALLDTLNASKDLNRVVNLLGLSNFAEGQSALNQLLMKIIGSSSDVNGIQKLKETAIVLKNSKKNYLLNEMRMIVKNYLRPVTILSKVVSGKSLLEVTGKHMIMSNVISDVEPFLSTISEVHFVAEVIHIDKNLNKYIWSSKTIKMKAKIIHVHQKVEWDLSGYDGSVSEENKRHGKNGGLVFISAEELINGSQLTIKLNGGDGRNGQEAGQITDGIDGKSVDSGTIHEETEWVWDDHCTNDGGVYEHSRNGFKCEYLCHRVSRKHEMLTVCYGTDAIPPTYQPKITVGKAGFSGTAIIIVNIGDKNIIIIDNNGKDGKIKVTNFKSKIGSKGIDRATMNTSRISDHRRYVTGCNEKFSIGITGHNCPNCVWNHQKQVYYGLLTSNVRS